MPRSGDMLLRKFGDEYMLLFARPADNMGNGEIDWYSPVQGPVQKLVDLPEEEEQADMENTLAHMASEILSLMRKSSSILKIVSR